MGNLGENGGMSGDEMPESRGWSVALERVVRLRAEGASETHFDLPVDPGRWHVYPYRLEDSRPARRWGPPSTIAPLPSAPTFLPFGRPAVCGATIKAVLPRGGEVDDPDICPDCAQHLRDGTWVQSRRKPRRRGNACDAIVTVSAGDARRRPDDLDVYGGKVTFACSKRWNHPDWHRAPTGETWLMGDDDFTPAPDGFV